MWVKLSKREIQAIEMIADSCDLAAIQNEDVTGTSAYRKDLDLVEALLDRARYEVSPMKKLSAFAARLTRESGLEAKKSEAIYARTAEEGYVSDAEQNSVFELAKSSAVKSSIAVEIRKIIKKA